MAQPDSPPPRSPRPPPAGLPTFAVSVVYQNTGRLPAEMRRRVSAPAGVEARQPFFASLSGLVLVKQARRRRFGYEGEDSLAQFAVGYTDTDLAVSFSNFGSSWRRDGDIWRFAGGEILLTLSVGVHVDERANAAGRRRCLELILEHELLHVRDEIDIVTNWLPAQALADAFVRANVSADARIPANDFDARIRGTGDGRGSALEQRIQRQIYIFESGDRAAALHRGRPQDMRNIGRCMGAG